ncbi:SOS response-associated peptidase [bacterium]|nr:SOS response-associated peptidase [bacterium]
MCGRFTWTEDLEQMVASIPGFKLAEGAPARFNAAPSQQVPTILNDGSRSVTLSQWGLIPSWAKDPAIGNRMINARAETIAEKPSFRVPLRRQRCLILADGFFEWFQPAGEKGKQPVYVRLKSRKPFAFAGLWDRWQTPSGDKLTSCTIITTTPNELMARFHHRMPVILPEESYEAWLAPGEQPVEDLLPLLTRYPAELMEAFPVSRQVNNPIHEGPDLVEPIQMELPLE